METHICGAGLGLRIPHLREILNNDLAGTKHIPWFEILADNFLAHGGFIHTALHQVCERYPTVLHGVGLSIGSVAELDYDYLKRIKTLIKDTGSHWYSEHLSFSRNSHKAVPDLLPLPYTNEAVNHLSKRIRQVQDYLNQRILIENVSCYVSFGHSTMDEGTFLSAIAEEADCDILLDINNAYVNSMNFSADLGTFLEQIPIARVKQIHLAGHEHKGDFLLDTHNKPVSKEVWDAFEQCIATFGQVPSMIEWDNDLPELPRLLDERKQAETILNRYKAEANA